jgi:hypothetical protein
MDDSGEWAKCLLSLVIIFPKPPYPQTFISPYPPNQGIQISGISTCIVVIYRVNNVSGMIYLPLKNNVKPSYLI